jgi:outer membrane protein OmpA-like peptidoglycan-associated protein
MNGIRLLVLAAATMAAACATQAPPKGELQGKLDKVYADDHGEWLKHESAANRNLETAHTGMRHMENDYYWNIEEMTERANAAAVAAADNRAKAEEVHKRIMDKRLKHLDSIHVTEADAVVEIESFATFRTGASSPSKVKNKSIRDILAALRRHPNGYAEVRAFTDTVGNAKSNERLARARADHVKSILVSNGANTVHTVAVPVGEADGPDDTPDAHNRRVDVLVFPHGKGPR